MHSISLQTVFIYVLFQKARKYTLSSRNNKYTIFLYEQNAQFTKWHLSASLCEGKCLTQYLVYSTHFFSQSYNCQYDLFSLLKSVLFFYIILQFLQVKDSSSLNLQFFIVLCVCYSISILSGGLDLTPLQFNIVHVLLLTQHRAYSTHYETWQVFKDIGISAA